MAGSNGKIPNCALVLALAGVVPFWVGTALYIWPAAHISAPGAVKMTIAYGAVILSFLGGVRWGSALTPSGEGRLCRDLTLSVVPSLAGFAALFLPSLIALNLLVAGFLLQALWDVISAQDQRLPGWFARLRVVITCLVVPSLLVIIGKAVLQANA